MGASWLALCATFCRQFPIATTLARLALLLRRFHRFANTVSVHGRLVSLERTAFEMRSNMHNNPIMSRVSRLVYPGTCLGRYMFRRAIDKFFHD